MDSKLFVAIIVFAHLAGEARCGLLDGLPFFKKSPADYDTLNIRLCDNVKSSQMADNVKYVKDNMDTFEDERVKYAADLLVRVSEMKATVCDEQVLSVLNDVAQTNLNIYGHKRIEKLMFLGGLRDAWIGCEKQAKKSIVSLDQDYQKFFQYFRRASTKEILDELRLEVLLIKNEKFSFQHRDEKTRDLITVKVAKRFENALDKYVMRRCEELLADVRFKKLLDRYETLKIFNTVDLEDIQEGYTKMAWTKGKCNEFLAMDTTAKANLFQYIPGKEMTE